MVTEDLPTPPLPERTCLVSNSLTKRASERRVTYQDDVFDLGEAHRGEDVNECSV